MWLERVVKGRAKRGRYVKNGEGGSEGRGVFVERTGERKGRVGGEMREKAIRKEGRYRLGRRKRGEREPQGETRGGEREGRGRGEAKKRGLEDGEREERRDGW